MLIQSLNSAILSGDVLIDSAKLLQGTATPAEFHALNSLVEAAVFHEHLYVYAPKVEVDSTLFQPLEREGVLHQIRSLEPLTSALKIRELEDVADEVLIDGYWGSEAIGYDTFDELHMVLSSTIEFEEKLGIARISKLEPGVGDNDFPLFLTRLAGFSREDTLVFDSTFRKMRALAVASAELAMNTYTGLVWRPFLLSHLASQRRGALALYDRMCKELSDVDDSELPQWRRIEIPILTQRLLARSKDTPNAVAQELLELRQQLRAFRETLTTHAAAEMVATTRIEKRKVRQELEKAWAALLEQENRKSRRLLHQAWQLLKKPLAILETIGDMLVDRNTLDQAVNRYSGLTDLWAELSDAPTVEQNVGLLNKVFRVQPDYEKWEEVRQLAAHLESVMVTNVLPELRRENS